MLFSLFRPVAAAQSAESASQIGLLLNSDPAVRAATKSELLKAANPALVPELLRALRGLPPAGQFVRMSLKFSPDLTTP